MTFRAPLVLGPLLGLLLGSGCVLSAEAELPDIEIIQHDLVIPGAPPDPRTPEPAVGLSIFIQPQAQLALDKESYSSVQVREVTLAARSGVNNLAFIRTLQVGLIGIAAQAAGMASVPVVSYTRSASGAELGTTLTMPSRPPAEVVGPWRDTLSVMTLDVTGALPQETWVVDVIIHLSAKLSY